MIAQHSSKSNDWGTPAEWIERVRAVLGEIDLDPASSEKHNLVVGASRYYTEKENGLTQRWAGRVFLNPPGGRGLPKAFLTKLVSAYSLGHVSEAVYLGYSLEQLLWAPVPNPGTIAIPHKRIKFLGAGSSPTHGNFFLYMGPNRDKFLDVFRDCRTLKNAWCGLASDFGCNSPRDGFK